VLSARGAREQIAAREARPAPASTPASRFVALLEARGEVTTLEAMRALGLRDPRAVGGAVGATNRWAARQGGPFVEARIREDGEKVYAIKRPGAS
jgi:hypothetical protein